MAKKTIVARTYIAGEPIGKFTYDTNENNELGKKMARLFLDELVGYVRAMRDDEKASWAITYTDGEEELTYRNGRTKDDIVIEIDGERSRQINAYTSERTQVMWQWLAERGWY